MLIAITGVHVLLVRVHGVSLPIDGHAAEVKETGRLRRRAIAAREGGMAHEQLSPLLQPGGEFDLGDAGPEDIR